MPLTFVGRLRVELGLMKSGRAQCRDVCAGQSSGARDGKTVVVMFDANAPKIGPPDPPDIEN
jgi:hypothetical protein